MNTIRTQHAMLFIIAIHAVYFFVAQYFKGFYLVDSYGYLMQAKNIDVHQSWYAENWDAPLLVDYFSIRPPLYAIIIMVFGSASTILLLLFQNVLSILNCWLVFKFTNRIGKANRNTNRLLALALICYPAQLIYTNMVMTEIVFQTLLLLLFLATFAFCNNPQLNTSFGIGILLSLCLLTKPISLLLPIIILVIMCWSILKQKRSYWLTLPLILAALTLHVICLQNKHATSYYHYSSIKAINQLKYNAKYTLVNAKGEQYADSTISTILSIAARQSSYGERLQYMESQANQLIFQYPFSFLTLYTKGVFSFFLDPGRFDVFHYFSMEKKETIGLMYEIQTKGLAAIFTYLKSAPLGILFMLLVNFIWNTFILLAFTYFLVKSSNQFPLKILAASIVLYIAAATGPVGVSRYRVPVYPLLVIGLITSSYSYKKNNANTPF